VTSNRTTSGYSNGVRLDACGKFSRARRPGSWRERHP
jgi:hypothetical protein